MIENANMFYVSSNEFTRKELKWRCPWGWVEYFSMSHACFRCHGRAISVWWHLIDHRGKNYNSIIIKYNATHDVQLIGMQRQTSGWTLVQVMTYVSRCYAKPLPEPIITYCQWTSTTIPKYKIWWLRVKTNIQSPGLGINSTQNKKGWKER